MTGRRGFDPLLPWSIAAGLFESGLRVAEAIGASHAVIGSRCRTIVDAACDPPRGNYRELGRMVPEKVDAFAKSGRAAFGDVAAIQSDAFAGLQQAGRLMLSGRLPSAAEAEAMAARSARMIDRALGAGDKAFEPVHKRVTANARRLRGTGKAGKRP